MRKNIERSKSSKRITAILLVTVVAALFAATTDAAAQSEAQETTRRVTIPKNQKSVVLKGTVKAGATNYYTFAAKKNQLMSARLTSTKNNARFNLMILESHDAIMLTPGESGFADWKTVIPTAGDYSVAVFSTGGVAAYTVEVSFAANPSAPPSDSGVYGVRRLADFRYAAPGAVNLAPGDKQEILRKVFPSYLADLDQCAAGGGELPENYLEENRRAGQIVPNIIAQWNGWFMIAAADAATEQTVYLIDVGECNAARSDGNGTERLAVFSGDTLVADIALEDKFTTAIWSGQDIDGDGTFELMLGGSDMGQGISTQWASVVGVRGKKLRVIKEFGNVAEDSCGSLQKGSRMEAATIDFVPASLSPDKKDIYHIENYRAACPKEDVEPRWKLIRRD